MLKLLGIIISSLSVFLLGLSCGSGWRARIEDLVGFKRRLIMLKSEISYSLCSLPEAFANAAEGDERYGDFWRDVSWRLKEKSGETFSYIWDLSAKKHLGKLAFTDKDLLIISRLGGVLGLADVQSQTENILLAVSSIDAKLDELCPVCEKNVKLYRSLGVLGALAIAVTLI